MLHALPLPVSPQGWVRHMLGPGHAYYDLLIFIHFVLNSLNLPSPLSFFSSNLFFIY